MRTPYTTYIRDEWSRTIYDEKARVEINREVDPTEYWDIGRINAFFAQVKWRQVFLYRTVRFA